ncbi:MAG: hypothetical protein ACI4MM_03255 [Candidatus Ventricola sp.]
MEYTEEIVERIRREAYQDGFDAAMEKLRLAVRLAKMGEADCKIVDKTGLPPYIIHAMLGED